MSQLFHFGTHVIINPSFCQGGPLLLLYRGLSGVLPAPGCLCSGSQGRERIWVWPFFLSSLLHPQPLQYLMSLMPTSSLSQCLLKVTPSPCQGGRGSHLATQASRGAFLPTSNQGPCAQPQPTPQPSAASGATKKFFKMVDMTDWMKYLSLILHSLNKWKRNEKKNLKESSNFKKRIFHS